MIILVHRVHTEDTLYWKVGISEKSWFSSYTVWHCRSMVWIYQWKGPFRIHAWNCNMNLNQTSPVLFWDTYCGSATCSNNYLPVKTLSCVPAVHSEKDLPFHQDICHFSQRSWLEILQLSLPINNYINGSECFQWNRLSCYISSNLRSYLSTTYSMLWALSQSLLQIKYICFTTVASRLSTTINYA